jgi:hypothetical protein
MKLPMLLSAQCCVTTARAGRKAAAHCVETWGKGDGTPAENTYNNTQGGDLCVCMETVHRETHWCCTRPSGDQIAMGTSMPPVIMVWLKGS